MSKTSITWIELINKKIKERKEKNMPAGVKDVLGESKKEWELIKSGKHDKYVQGKPSATKPKSKGKTAKHSKTEKHSKTAKHKKSSKNEKSKHNKERKMIIHDILKDCDLCEECMEKVKKQMNV